MGMRVHTVRGEGESVGMWLHTVRGEGESVGMRVHTVRGGGRERGDVATHSEGGRERAWG